MGRAHETNLVTIYTIISSYHWKDVCLLNYVADLYLAADHSVLVATTVWQCLRPSWQPLPTGFFR